MHSLKAIAALTSLHRKKAGLTQHELANLAGIGRTAVQRLEQGDRPVQIDTLMAVCGVLNINFELLGPLENLSLHALAMFDEVEKST